MELGEGVLAGSDGVEGLLVGALSEEEAEEAVLLAFVGKGTSNTSGEAIVVGGSSLVDDVSKDALDEVGG